VRSDNVQPAMLRGSSATALFLAAALAGCASERVRDDTFPFQSPEIGTGPIAWEPADEGGDSAAATAQLPERDVETLRLFVDGMTCPVRCAREVRNMLTRVPGVLNVAVDVPSRSVLANVERGTDPQTLVDAIRAPYRARLL
jgi:copper chaperone CopZ